MSAERDLTDAVLDVARAWSSVPARKTTQGPEMSAERDLADAVRAVLDAARAMCRDSDRLHWYREERAVGKAVDRLNAVLAAPVEIATTWGKVLAGDEVYSRNTRQWYPVRAVLDMSARLPREVSLDIETRPNFVRRYVKNFYDDVVIRRPASPERDAVSALEAAGFDVSTLASGQA